MKKIIETELKKIDLTLDNAFETGNRIKSKQMMWQLKIPKGAIKLFIEGSQIKEENKPTKTEYWYSFRIVTLPTRVGNYKLNKFKYEYKT